MFASAAAVVVAVSLLASSAVAQSCGRNYTVSLGDTCDSISAAHSVSTYQLAMLNTQIDDACSNLELGEGLCLGLVGSSDCQQTHTVAAGDTCDGITASYAGLNSTYLYLNNPQIDAACDNIYVGEVLCVGAHLYVAVGGASAPPAVSSAPAALPSAPAAAATAPSSSSSAAATTLVVPPSSSSSSASTSSVVSTTAPVAAAPTPSSVSVSSSSSTPPPSPTSSAPAPTSTDDDDLPDCEDDE